MEKRRFVVKGKYVASTAYLRTKKIVRSISDETKFQVSEFRKNTEPLRIELKLAAMDHLEVVRKHSQPIVDALATAINEQVRATRERHKKMALLIS